MKTPVIDFLKKYADSETTRFHMPGHKGRGDFGFEKYDITEVKGADSLYEADGIIAESEDNATRLFGSGRTVYSTEGSSQCIRAMLYLAACESMKNGGDERPLFIAARNVHKAFVYGAALVDADVKWMYDGGEDRSLCACRITPETVEEMLAAEERQVAGVYITCPDYLGNMNDIKTIAGICHRYGTRLLVDNAHGAYLHFLKEPAHPLDLGADLCCDSAHKTLPVITGGAYLHAGKDAPERFGKNAKQAMGLFGSTSPSYLIMASLDGCNRYLEEKAPAEFSRCADRLDSLRKKLAEKGWNVKEDTDPLRVTICAGKNCSGDEIAEKLRKENIECEYSDPEYAVLMISPLNSKEEIDRLEKALGTNAGKDFAEENGACTENQAGYSEDVRPKQAISIREAVFAPSETVDVEESIGRICASPAVSCPPAVPIVVSGEIIDEKAEDLFRHYGIKEVSCVSKQV